MNSRTIPYSEKINHAGPFNEADLIDVCFTGGVYGLLQFGGVDFDVLAESLAGLGQVKAGFWRPVNDHQLPGLHLIDNLLDGVAIGTPFVIYIGYPRPVGGGRQDEAFFSTANLSNIVSNQCRQEFLSVENHFFFPATFKQSIHSHTTTDRFRPGSLT